MLYQKLPNEHKRKTLWVRYDVTKKRSAWDESMRKRGQVRSGSNLVGQIGLCKPFLVTKWMCLKLRLHFIGNHTTQKRGKFLQV